MQLPPLVYWGPKSSFDVESEGDLITAYQATIQEGRVVDQVEILNQDLLIMIWPTLTMPPRVRQLWEGRFPELTVKRDDLRNGIRGSVDDPTARRAVPCRAAWMPLAMISTSASSCTRTTPAKPSTPARGTRR
ncbi:hypothetical protein [Cryobacterium sp. TMT2-15-1]|uniref:hypothetical protein n=1 Tax=Cryobacterium sp. TMT2-15-1 TaxID=1259246 RepID=UPI00141ABB08|nr:hypothetical protein [Cryobacterium sp. TMT2-15-1]